MEAESAHKRRVSEQVGVKQKHLIALIVLKAPTSSL